MKHENDFPANARLRAENAQLSKKIEELKSQVGWMGERIRLDDIRIKGIVARADRYAIELHDLKNEYR